MLPRYISSTQCIVEKGNKLWKKAFAPTYIWGYKRE